MSSTRQRLIANGLMLLTAAIWGFAFVGQRTGMEHLGPFSFNGLRFLLGATTLLPVLWYYRHTPAVRHAEVKTSLVWWGGLIAGVVLFAGASLQQIGLQYTSAGKAGFITGLYIVLVPMTGLFIGHRISSETWVGAVCTLIGLYLLSIHGDFKMSWGDTLELIGALFWTAHVLVIGWLSPKVSAIRLSIIQFYVTGILSLIIGLATESISLEAIQAAGAALLYTGLMSTSIAYTLQVVAQQWAQPSHAALILSLESMFAVIGGWLFLNETLPFKGLLGCGLMLTGMLVAQMRIFPASRRGAVAA
ncbi:DMT family transporter [Mangrovitalea sediminis]|uniref:DMT family transporter n=1 Tax=Mangrovitalea sediminis TaxID=1982043 RepID=UPI001D0D3192|nr:DMT family transporter [Mangrovitalea sediminis]